MSRKVANAIDGSGVRSSNRAVQSAIRSFIAEVNSCLGRIAAEVHLDCGVKRCESVGLLGVGRVSS